MKKRFAVFALLILSAVTMFSSCSVNERYSYSHRHHHDRYRNGYNNGYNNGYDHGHYDRGY
ncbi:hypothetical protein SNE25_28600 [Mucilaginibacter sabulilitoris]|uniref:Lipoprotein n=1 Tax=Mucilaginibacter sabulilitoris TaxID=1173583 RepID=A0ABZ0TJE5_9SPHI|nr:hypothetical protein [Mucilaginibacter sabulilitoris]WPU93285.1 hypothetical protein SNE25_28600 [Mucilaginibacter sabulilitoris]